MPKAVDKAITNRRTFLSVLAAAVPAAAIANGTAPAAATEADPIFAAIEKHRAAFVVFDAAEREHHAVLQQLEAEDCRPSIAVGNSSTLANLATHNDIDFHLSGNVLPEHLKRLHAGLDEAIQQWESAQRPTGEVLDAAVDAEQTALHDMKGTRPTTRDGALALLDYYLERPWGDEIEVARPGITRKRRSGTVYIGGLKAKIEDLTPALITTDSLVAVDENATHLLYTVRLAREEIGHKSDYNLTAAELGALLAARQPA